VTGSGVFFPVAGIDFGLGYATGIYLDITGHRPL
jgi:hypothetical protein